MRMVLDESVFGRRCFWMNFFSHLDESVPNNQGLARRSSHVCHVVLTSLVVSFVFTLSPLSFIDSLEPLPWHLFSNAHYLDLRSWLILCGMGSTAPHLLSHAGRYSLIENRNDMTWSRSSFMPLQLRHCAQCALPCSPTKQGWTHQRHSLHEKRNPTICASLLVCRTWATPKMSFAPQSCLG